jgi:SAM-dependent methyltransferase
MDYKKVNKESWNARVDTHYDSEFYDVKGFLEGNTSLQSIELELLGDLTGLKILHLQCHFGQDTISLSRMGAEVTGVDLSDVAIDRAKKLAGLAGTNTRFIQSDIYDLPEILDEKFDMVFTTYGTIGWLPDMDKWANVISNFLKTNGKLIFVEFHPVVWMFDDDFTKIGYNYFNVEPIVETNEGTYAEQDANLELSTVSWNHPISEVVNALIKSGLTIKQLDEFNYSPYDCVRHMIEFEPGRFKIKHFENDIPMVYSIVAEKK